MYTTSKGNKLENPGCSGFEKNLKLEQSGLSDSFRLEVFLYEIKSAPPLFQQLGGIQQCGKDIHLAMIIYKHLRCWITDNKSSVMTNHQ